jgi:hypothetical protein
VVKQREQCIKRFLGFCFGNSHNPRLRHIHSYIQAAMVATAVYDKVKKKNSELQITKPEKVKGNGKQYAG